MTTKPGRAAVELSIVVPMFNEEEAIVPFFRRVQPILRSITDRYEIICVDDGSRDATRDLVKLAHARDGRIKLIELSRNFGKEVALTAGIDHARGEAVVPMDADLQDPPELLPELVRQWRNGFDVVLAVRADRASDGWLKRTTARLFYRIIGSMAEIRIPPNAGDFRLLSRPVVDALARLPERTRFMKGLFAWLGFRTATVTYSRPVRVAGSTKWKYWRLWNFAIEGLTSFSSLPLRIWSYVGMATAAMAILYMVWVVARTLLFGVDVPGYASLISVVLFFNGLVLLNLGIMGEYLGRIFVEVKQRPLYIVRGTLGLEADEPAPPEALSADHRLQAMPRATVSSPGK